MKYLLFADGGWWEILFTVGVVVVWAISNIIRGFADSKEAAPKKVAQPLPREKPKEKLDPQKELQKFLDELGIKEKVAEAKTAPAANERNEKSRPQSPRPVPPPPKPAKQQKSRNKPPQEPTPARPVRERHLESQLQGRHTASMQVSLENQHLQTRVGNAPSTAVNVEVVVEKPKGARGVDVGFPLLISDKQQLARAFMFSTILGKPRAFDDI